MEIVDKTNETWKIGDIVIDNDERKGIIKKTKDDDFVIVRIDEKHVGDYFCGLAYEAGINMYCLQHKASEFHKVNDNNGNGQWQLGDVLVDDYSHVGLIVKNDDEKYCLIDIVPDNKGNYSTISHYGNCYETLAEFYGVKHRYWHKVNAKLVIE